MFFISFYPDEELQFINVSLQPTTVSIIQFNGKLPQQTQPMQSVLWLKFSAEYAIECSWGMYHNNIISPNLQSYIKKGIR